MRRRYPAQLTYRDLAHGQALVLVSAQQWQRTDPETRLLVAAAAVRRQQDRTAVRVIVPVRDLPEVCSLLGLEGRRA